MFCLGHSIDSSITILTVIGDIDFNSLPDQTVPSRDIDSSFGHSTDMTTLNSSYVDPTAIGGQEDTSRTQSIQPHPVRAYPGMHTENAQRQAIAQQQQQRQSHSRQPSRNGGANKAVDPLLDQSISRLLNQMRHSSVASSHDENDDDPTTPNANGQTYGNRKDEEDMDEDEKLLASEEGKKLSSKERRQLRNKVSARAFRSRRKEYIGQLEGEINVKNTECEDLRRKNEQLKAENTRLTDLTQMLLSSPHFQPFLEELGRSEAAASGNMPSQVPRLQLHTPAPVSQTSSRSKDVNPNHVIPHQSQDNMHIGLTMVPEEPAIDFTVIDPLNTHYGHSDFSPLYMNSQVYAVTAVPQGPAVDRPDFGLLSGKLSNFVGPYSPLEDNGKDEPLSVHSLPAKTNTIETIETPAENLTIDVSDAALALYSGSEGSLSVAAPRTVAPEDSMFGEIELDKAFSRIELSIDSTANITIESEISSAVLERFERLCSRCDLLSSRIATHTAHLL